MYPLMVGFKSYIYPFLLSFFWLELFLKMSNVVLGYEIVWLKKNNKEESTILLFLKKRVIAGVKPSPFGFEGQALLHIQEL